MPSPRKLAYRAVDVLTTRTLPYSEYLAWLGFANPGMLHRGNIYAMDYVIGRMGSSPILEIGSFCGLSTNVIAHLMQKHGKRNPFFCCDKWVFEGSEEGPTIGESAITRNGYREFVKASFIRNVEFFSGERKPFAIEALSDDFFRMWGRGDSVADVFGRSVQLGGRLSFIYVDGNHTYEQASRDFRNASIHLDNGGFVLFDDSSDEDAFGLSRLMQEVRKDPRFDLVMKNPNYLFRARY